MRGLQRLTPFVVALLWAAMLVCTVLPAWAQSGPPFPTLGGPVVDTAGILSPATRAALTAKLEAHKAAGTDEVVVATIPSLQGAVIEDYANRLFRHWKLGEATKNNGVLLLIARDERKLRIEVGYGLEGTLTDAISSLIIRNSIAPRFKAGDFDGGVTRGVDDILQVLTGDAEEFKRRAERPAAPAMESDAGRWLMLVIICIFLLAIYANFRLTRRNGAGSRWRRRGNDWIWIGPSSAGPRIDTSSWSSGPSFPSGGSSWGGGGSSGGGGASGGW